MVSVLSFQPSYLGSIRPGVAIAWNGTIRSERKRGKIITKQSFFGFKTLHYIVRVGAAMPT